MGEKSHRPFKGTRFMKIRFWGVRGSIPAPAKDSAEFGGNTSCVEIVLSNGHSIIIDAGTGIRQLGLDYISRQGASRNLHLFVSHAHWDHIQGFPFFVPIFLADFTVNIYSHLDMRQVLNHQMQPPFFPVKLADLGSKINFHQLNGAPIEVEGAKISFVSLYHPQAVYGFRIDEGGKSVVYSSDTEHDNEKADAALVEFSKDADVLLYDAQYTPDQYAKGRVGWGHSTYLAAADIVNRADVKKLVLFHHEPTHNDEALRGIENLAKEVFPNTISAREGGTLEV